MKAYQRWMDKIPPVYRTAVLGETLVGVVPKVENDKNCLAQLKHYRSLMPLAMEAHKPMFHLKPADGAIGAHVEAVRDCRLKRPHDAQTQTLTPQGRKTRYARKCWCERSGRMVGLSEKGWC